MGGGSRNVNINSTALTLQSYLWIIVNKSNDNLHETKVLQKCLQLCFADIFNVTLCDSRNETEIVAK